MKVKDQKAYDAVIRARTVLLVSEPFFGCLALHLLLEEDESIPTAAVNGVTMFYNPKFWLSLSEPEQVGVCAHEVMHCFPAGTFVAGAYRPIEAINTSNYVIDEEGKRTRIVARSKRTYKGKLVSIHPKGMLPVEATTEHPFLVRRPKWGNVEKPKRKSVRKWSEAAWKKATELKVGDWVAVPILVGSKFDPLLHLNYKNPWSVVRPTRDGIYVDQELAEFVGWFVAEGWTTKSGVVSLSLGPNELPVALRLQDYIERKVGSKVRITPHATAKGFVLSFTSRGLSSWLNENCGMGAHNKKIPVNILENVDTTILMSFLKGYVAGDGHINKAAVHFGTVSRSLALQLQLAFARLGYVINLHLRKPAQSVIRGKVVKSGPLYHGHLANADLLSVFGHQSTARRPTQHFERVGDLIFVPIKKITTRQYNGPVFNFETGTHTYTAGNLVTHNCALQHMTRRGNRDPLLWNIAGDYRINWDIREAGFTLPGEPISLQDIIKQVKKKGHLYDPQFAKMSSEEIYEKLLQQQDKLPKGKTYILIIGNGQGKGQDGGEGADPGMCGAVIDASKPGKDGKGGGQVQAEKVAQDWEANIRLAVAVAQRSNAGTMPGYLDRLVNQLKEPRVSWRDLTRRFIDQSSSRDYTWSRPNRRFAGGGLILPGFKADAMNHLVACIDTSGSVSNDMLRELVSEMGGALDQGCADKLTMVYADTQVHHVDEFVMGEYVHARDVKGGGGGTDFDDTFQWIKKNAPDASCVIYLTDMMTNSFGKDPGCPTLWAAFCPRAYLDQYKPGFGEVVVVNTGD